MKRLVFLVVIFLCVIPFCNAENIDWKANNGNKIHAISNLIIDANGTILLSDYFRYDWAPFQGIAYHSNDSGKTWEAIRISDSNLVINQMLSQNGVFYIVRGQDGIRRSADDCKTWESINNGIPTNDIARVAFVSDSEMIAITTLNKVYYSSNSGLNWKFQDSSLVGKGSFYELGSDGKTVIIVTSNNTYRTTDKGLTWIPYRLPKLYSSSDHHFGYLSYNGSSFYTLSSNNVLMKVPFDDDSVYIVKDEKFNLNNIYGNISSFLMLADGSMLAGTSKGLLLLDSNLSNPIYYASEFKWANSKIAQLGDKFIICNTSAEITLLDTNTRKLKILNQNLTKTNIKSIVASSQKEIFALVRNDKILASYDSSKSWYPIFENQSLFGKIKDLSLTNNGNLYSLIDSVGFCWINSEDSYIVSESGLSSPLISISYSQDKKIYGTNSEGFYAFNENDSKWEIINDSLKNITFLNKNDSIIFLLDGSIIWQYDSNSSIFKKIDISSIKDKGIVCAELINENNVFVGTSSSGIFSTTDDGLNWTAKNTLLTAGSITSIVAINENELIASSSLNGIYYSNNQGAIWLRSAIGLTTHRINTILNIDNCYYLATQEDGLFACDSVRYFNVANYSGWTDSLNFKQQKELIGDTYKVRFSKDGSKFFTFSRDNYFRIWETESGLLLKEYYLSLEGVEYVDYYEKQNFLLIVNRNGKEYDAITHSWLSLENDSIIFSFPTTYKNFIIGYYPAGAIFDPVDVYFERNNSIFTLCTVTKTESSTTTMGGIAIYNLDSNKFNSMYKWIIPKSYALSYDNRFFALQGIGEVYGKPAGRLFYYEIDSAIFKELNYSNTVANLVYSFDDKYLFFSSDSNRIVVFDIEHNRVLSSYSTGYDINDYYDNACYVRCLASSKENYDFYTSSLRRIVQGTTYTYEHIIRKWNPKFDFPVDSIVFNDPSELWAIDISPNSKYLIAGGSKGHIRLINIESLRTGIPEQEISKSSNTLFIKPNPSSDYIEIKLNGEQLDCNNIEIVNSLGISQGKFLVNPDRRIYISALPKGIYFVRYCDYYGKFVKM